MLLEAHRSGTVYSKDDYRSDTVRVYDLRRVAYKHAPERTRHSGAEMPAVIALAIECGRMHIAYRNLDVCLFTLRRLKGETSFRPLLFCLCIVENWNRCCFGVAPV